MARKKREKIHNVSLLEQARNHKWLTFVYIFLRLSVVAIMIAQIFNNDWENVFYCVLALFLMFVPSFIEKNWHIDIPDTLEIIVLLFIYAAEILGELRAYYINIPFWDTMLHTTTGFLAAAVGFSLCDILNRNEHIKFSLSPVFLAFVAFCFSMTVGVLWEFFEFSMDFFTGADMQKDTIVHAIHTTYLDPTKTNKIVNITDITETVIKGNPEMVIEGYLDVGIYDTMKDLFVNFIGAVVFSIIGYFYTKSRGQGTFAKRFIPTMKFDELEEAEKEKQVRKAEKEARKEEKKR